MCKCQRAKKTSSKILEDELENFFERFGNLGK